MPALGITLIGRSTFSHSHATGWRIGSGPVEQLSPSASTRSAAIVVAAAATSVPSSIRPDGSRVTWTCRGTPFPERRIALRHPAMAAFTSSRS